MISSNELMIGSIVMKDGEQHEVIGILHGDIATDKSDGWFALEQFEPIELSPEILERYGFEKRVDYWGDSLGYSIHANGDNYLIIDLDAPDTMYGVLLQNRDCVEGYCSANEQPSLVHCENLHSLQNLYYSLTGKQLEGR